ncbi:hypothetical protein F3Y22_tig00110931pilonHSYRG00279 [Hibiscus syriacus]|uniref:ATP-dependent helicase C-terminal domain-containing protein n=1 Tax=Hibiscus syriacus TaxID=106335 RepID=A0A6A2ZEF7_HIBSY|nr:hypothetical protein F3Y22_tig00110931pilonHSYRG00279 [Hibiscus syriacus]
MKLLLRLLILLRMLLCCLRKIKSMMLREVEVGWKALATFLKVYSETRATVMLVHVQEAEVNASDIFKGKLSRTLGWWCFNPGIAMQTFTEMGVGSIIVTSGRPFNSSFRNRDSPEYKQELENAIVNFARIVPDGLLVSFPSYYLLDQCISCWKNMDYMTKLKDTFTSGEVFFAVCRGKVSEGLDFADHAGRAVVITGMPFATRTDPKVRLKREYLDLQAQSPRE